MIPYARQQLDEDDIAAVAALMRTEYLTTGPEVEAFERDLARVCEVEHAVSVSSGTAALHCAYAACGLGPGDELVTTPLTFAATASMALALGAQVRFADVDEGDLCLSKEARIGPRTKVIAPVDFAGQPADIEAFMRLGVRVVEDASHALGSRVAHRRVGGLAHATVLSFHPVKTITSAEGGAVLTNDAEIARAAREFRCHGLVREPGRLGSVEGPWSYEIQTLGFNYRMSALHAALGRSQLRKLDRFVARRAEIVARYDAAFADLGLGLPRARTGTTPAWHLYAVRCGARRAELAQGLRERGVGTQVHYIPLNQMPLFAACADATPIAARISSELLSLPLFPAMSDAEVAHVIKSVREVWG